MKWYKAIPMSAAVLFAAACNGDKASTLTGSPAVGESRSSTTSAAGALLAVNATTSSINVNAGDPINFTVTLANVGSASTSVTVTDYLPADPEGNSWSILTVSTPGDWAIIGSPGSQSLIYVPTSLAPGTSSTVTIVSSTSVASCGQTYANTVNASTLEDPIQSVSSSATASVSSCSSPSPTIGISKLAVASPVNAGTSAQFDITVSNTGAGSASDVGFTDALPSFGGTWSIVSQTNGGTACSIMPGSTTLTCMSAARRARRSAARCRTR